jgi:hypothetical protein
MRILAIDPGETTGTAVLESSKDSVELISYADLSLKEFKKELSVASLHYLEVERIVIEDYRIFQSKAGQHIGARLTTPELIGWIDCIRTLAGLVMVRVQPNKKGRWPKARLKNKFPAYFEVDQHHSKDAVIIGLVYLEAMLGVTGEKWLE